MRSLLRRIKQAIPQQSPLRLAWHHAKALIAALLYGFPARSLAVIGITGTDGKTTTVGMVAHILQECGVRTGALSTAFFRIADRIEWNATQKTSPSPFLIQRFLRRLVREGCTHVVIEYSSHGLIQGRSLFTWPRVAAITNIAEEHLDYHGTMEEYMRAKGLLFAMLRAHGTKVLHYDDRTFRSFSGINKQRTKTIIYNETCRDTDDRFGPPMNLWLSDVTTGQHGSNAQLTWHTSVPDAYQHYDLSLAIPGSFNLSNALCAIACVKGLPDPPPMERILAALRTFSGIPGRMERIDEGQPFTVFVDFTVTPQSYEKTMGTIRASLPAGRRLLVLTGSCGDRMKEKRAIVGGIVSRHADVTVVTNEDPYTEDPEQIIDEVWAGIDQAKTEAHRIADRREAVAFLFKKAQPGDIVVLCGKGSDTTMWVKEGQIPWNERAIARELLRLLAAPPSDPRDSASA